MRKANCTTQVHLRGDGLPVEMVAAAEREASGADAQPHQRGQARDHQRRMEHERRGGHALSLHDRPVHLGIQVSIVM